MIHSSDHIALFTANQNLLDDSVKQMEKDMALSGVTYTFQASDPGNLVNELALFIEQHEHSKVWPNLLYRIDINPNSDLISHNDHQKISIALWNRVLKKVISRKLFS